MTETAIISTHYLAILTVFLYLGYTLIRARRRGDSSSMLDIVLAAVLLFGGMGFAIYTYFFLEAVLPATILIFFSGFFLSVLDLWAIEVEQYPLKGISRLGRSRVLLTGILLVGAVLTLTLKLGL